MEEKQPIALEELEKQIFAKSLKTKEGTLFGDSPWIKRYETFKQKRNEITQKIETEGITSLNEDERKWYEKYERFQKKQEEKKRMNKLEEENEVDLNLLKTFYSKEYREKWPAMKVFYPTSDWLTSDEKEAEQKGLEESVIDENILTTPSIDEEELIEKNSPKLINKK